MAQLQTQPHYTPAEYLALERASKAKNEAEVYAKVRFEQAPGPRAV